MKVLMTLVLCCFSLLVNAQDNATENDTRSVVSTEELFLLDKLSKGYHLTTNICLPKLDSEIEHYLAQGIYGIDAPTIDEAKKQYYKLFKKTVERELKTKAVVNLDITECYRIVPSNIVCYKYNTISLKTPSDISYDKFITYDFKNKKVVTISDLIKTEVLQSLADKGLKVNHATDIRLADDSLFINLSGTMLNIDVSKFYANLTDYALDIMGRTREGYAAKTELATVVTPKPDAGEFKAAEFPGGMQEMMKYLQENAKYPDDMPATTNHDINLMASQQQMQRQQAIRELEAKQNGEQGQPAQGGAAGPGGMPFGGGMGGFGGGMPMGGMGGSNTMVAVTVNSDGSIYSIKTRPSDNPFYKREALKCIEAMPKFAPATLGGTPVRNLVNLPFNFRKPGRGFGGFGMGGFGF